MDLNTNVSSLQSLIKLSPVNTSFFKLLVLIQTQVQFSTILFLTDGNAIDAEVEFAISLGVSVIHLTKTQHYCLKNYFDDNMIAVVYLNKNSYREIIDSLAKSLNQMAQTKIVLICSGLNSIIREIFEICWKKKLINTVALLEDTMFSYNPFPQMQIEEYAIQDIHLIFPNRMLNVYGYPLRSMLDGIEPRDFSYTNRRGEELAGGYISHLVAAFGEKINATLVQHKTNKTQVFHHSDYDSLLASDMIDISGGVAFLTLKTKGQSYIAELCGYCLIVPTEPNLPQYLYYPLILQSLPMLLIYGMVVLFSFTINCFYWVETKTKIPFWKMFLLEDCVRAILGQPLMGTKDLSMKMRVIFFLSCIMGLFFNTWYLAILNTLVTYPPREPPLTTIEDIYRSPLKILMYRGEYNDVLQATDEFEKYIDTFEFTWNNSWYHATRSSLNKSYAYPAPDNKWKIFEEQQSYYKTPIARYTEVCLIRVSLMVLLLHENSIFTKDFNELMLRTHQSGLYDHWLHTAFLELVEGGRINLSLRSDDGPSPLTLDDMRWLWGLFGMLALIDCMVFTFEWFFNRYVAM